MIYDSFPSFHGFPLYKSVFEFDFPQTCKIAHPFTLLLQERDAINTEKDTKAGI